MVASCRCPLLLLGTESRVNLPKQQCVWDQHFFFLLSDTVLLTYKIYSDWSRIVIRINILCSKCYHANIDGEDRFVHRWCIVATVFLTYAVFLKIKQIRKRDWSRQYPNSLTWAEILGNTFKKMEGVKQIVTPLEDTVLHSISN